MDADVASVAAPYKSRYHVGYVAWMEHMRPLLGGQSAQQVGGNGFGCTLLRRSIMRQTTFAHRAETGDFDPNFYAWLARHEGGRYRALLDWSCKAARIGIATCWHVQCRRAGGNAL